MRFAVSFKLALSIVAFSISSTLIFFHLAGNPRQVSKSSKRLAVVKSPAPLKVVLLWTKYFSSSTWFGLFQANVDENGGQITLPSSSDRTKQCLLTLDRSVLSQADLVVFHSRNLNFEDLPGDVGVERRRWALFSMESPYHNGLAEDEALWNLTNSLGFNWTISYTKLADSFFPYVTLRRGSKTAAKVIEAKIDSFVASFRTRSIDAVWIVSNCAAENLRREIVEALLASGITIEVWGSRNCLEDSSSYPTNYSTLPDVYRGSPDEALRQQGWFQFFSRYRFVLAFENSLCTDYVTEKAYTAFYVNYLTGAIPVLYGQATYSDFFEKGSFIDVNSFENVEKLAKFLKNLSEPSNVQLRSFYRWLKVVDPLYETGIDLADDGSDAYVGYSDGWQKLCDKLWHFGDDNDVIKSGVSVKDKLGQCYPPRMEFLSQTMQEE